MSYQFFSESDIDPKTGKIKSEYPNWYDPRLMQDLEDEIRTKEIALETGQVPKGYESDYRQSLDAMKKQHEKMANMTLVDDAKNDRGKIGSVIKKLSKMIADELPTQRQCDKNIVDSNLEYRKMTEPKYKIDEETAEMAKACNVPINENGCVNGFGLHKIWKIGSKYLGEYANVESLRKA